jgi:hypothetical protein
MDDGHFGSARKFLEKTLIRRLEKNTGARCKIYLERWDLC